MLAKPSPHQLLISGAAGTFEYATCFGTASCSAAITLTAQQWQVLLCMGLPITRHLFAVSQ